MWFRTVFDSLKARTRRSPVRTTRRSPSRLRPASYRLGVEPLEDRLVPASLTVSDVSIVEGSAGTRSAMVTVSMIGSSNPTVSVDYRTANGTAVSGIDYQ